MKRLFFVMVVGLLIFAYGCGGSDDPKAVIEQMLDVSEDFAANIDKAESADDVVKAVEEYADALKGMEEKLMKVKEKYPDLGKGEMPEELKDLEERFKKFGQTMMGLGAKVGQYMTDENVMKAFQKLQEASKVLQK